MLKDLHKSTYEEVQNAFRAFRKKIDLFMQVHILPIVSPEKIHWWFSLSGGKDSYSMAEGVREWYYQNGFNLVATAFTINQWDGPAHDSIVRQIPWTQVIMIDGREPTSGTTGYRHGNQAPCRVCADVRRSLTDQLVMRTSKGSFVNLIARGLHLSDTATSIAWRHVMGLEPSKNLLSQNKGLPLTPILKDTYIAKPLFYAREFESACFAALNGFQPSCCGCPACMFPSRRDIVEESVLLFYNEPIWELQVPGIRSFLSNIAPNKIIRQVESCSAPGKYTKPPHLPHNFHDFVVSKFAGVLPDSWKLIRELFDPGCSLDDIGTSWILSNPIPKTNSRVPLPMTIVDSNRLSLPQRMMVATLGPMWGAIGLTPPLQQRAWDIQKTIFGFSANQQWSQVNDLLKNYYNKDSNPQRNIKNSTAYRFCDAYQSCNCSGNTGVYQ